MRHPIYALLMLVAVLLLAPVLTARAMGTTKTQKTPPHAMGGMSVTQNCPMQVSGADLAIVDTNDGIALSVTTQSGDVAELRRRVETMAKMHSNEGMHGDMTPFTVLDEEIPNGARLTLTPIDPTKLEEFRKIVRQHAEQMKKHDCSMMQEMMSSQTQPSPDTQPKTDESDHSAHHPGGQK